MLPEVPSPKATAICAAISERCEIQFLYQEQPVLLQPHILFCDIAGVAIVEGVVPPSIRPHQHFRSSCPETGNQIRAGPVLQPNQSLVLRNIL
jgi:hypothetical protein